jgi:hypothetical protein
LISCRRILQVLLLRFIIWFGCTNCRHHYQTNWEESKTASIMSNIVFNYDCAESANNHDRDEKSHSKAISSFCSIIAKAANNKPWSEYKAAAFHTIYYILSETIRRRISATTCMDKENLYSEIIGSSLSSLLYTFASFWILFSVSDFF